MSERAELRTLSEERRIDRLSEELCFRLASTQQQSLTPKERAHIQQWKNQRLIPHLQEIATYANNRSDMAGADRNPDRIVMFALFYATRYGNKSIDGQEELIESLCDGLSESYSKLINGMSTHKQLDLIQVLVSDNQGEPFKRPSVDEFVQAVSRTRSESQGRE